MKLYDCNRGDKIRLLDTKFPPDYPPELVEELKKKVWTLRKIDGMYSMCYDEKGNLHHPAAWSEVEVVENGSNDPVPFD